MIFEHFEDESIISINEETITEKGQGYKLVNGDNGKKYIVFQNVINPKFTLAVNYKDYTSQGLKGFYFNTQNQKGGVVLSNVKFVHGSNGKDYIVLINKMNPKYTIAINLKDFQKNGYSLKGFNLKNGITSSNTTKSLKEQIIEYTNLLS
jgi:hypothetical protein